MANKWQELFLPILCFLSKIRMYAYRKMDMSNCHVLVLVSIL